MTFELKGEHRPTSLEGPGNPPSTPHPEQTLYQPAYLTNPFYDPFSQDTYKHPGIPRQRTEDSFRVAFEAPDVIIASLEERLRKAHTDELTGLQKREKFIEELGQLVKEQPGNIVLLFFDLDGLKKINDTHEDKHAAGDDLLYRTGKTLRQNDIVKQGCRYGGDEICVIVRGDAITATCGNLPDADRRTPHKIEPENMFTIIERLRGELAGEGIEVSIGGAIHMEGETAEELISRADAAMYIDKAARKKARRRQQLGALTTRQQAAVYAVSILVDGTEIPPEELPDLLKAATENPDLF